MPSWPSSASAAGISVAIDGDTIVVGAYSDDRRVGAYVFREDWTGRRIFRVAKLMADAAANDWFGYRAERLTACRSVLTTPPAPTRVSSDPRTASR